MTERPFALLTQEHCPACDRLERMLAGPLRGQYAAQIEVVHRQQHPSAFEALAATHSLRATPALLHRPSGQVLAAPTGLGEVQRFFALERVAAGEPLSQLR